MIDEFYQEALAALQHQLEQAGAAYELDDGELVVDSHRLGLSISFEGFASQDQWVLAPLDIRIHLDGDEGDRFRVGTLGVGTDRTSARSDAVSQWHLLAAAPLLSALGVAVDKRRAAKAQSLAGWDLFAGRAGVRGSVPPELRGGGPFLGTLLRCLRDEVATWPRPDHFTLRSIYVMATCGQGAKEIQTAIDGLVDPPLAELLSRLAWPTDGDTYLYKQLFVLRWTGQG